MAYTFTVNLTEVSLCEALSDTYGVWTGTGDAPALESENIWQGTYSIAYSFRNETGWAVFTFTNANDLSDIDTHLYWWMDSYVGPQLSTQANGGLRVRLEDSGGDYKTYFYGGSDTYDGGWVPFVQWCHATDYNAADSNNPTTVDMTDIKVISFGWDNTVQTKNVDNCFIDAVRYGTGITITGQPDTASYQYKGFHEIAAEDAKVANKWGVIYDLDGVLGCQGQINIGDPAQTATTLFESKSEIILFLNRRVRGGFLGTYHHGAASFQTTIRYGEQIGTGADSVGVKGSIFTAEGTTIIPRWYVDSSNITEFKMCACTVQNHEYVKLGDTGTALDPTTFVCIDNIFFNNTGLQKHVEPVTTDVQLRNRVVQMTGTYSIGIFDEEGMSGDGWILVDCNGAYFRYSSEWDDYDHPQANEDIDFVFPADITLKFRRPKWDNGYPLITWTYGTSELQELWTYDIVAQKADTTKIQNARCRIFDDYDDTFELDLDTDVNGEATGDVLYKYWDDGDAGTAPQVTYGPWEETIVAFGYQFYQAVASFAGVAINENRVLTPDSLIDQLESYYDGLTGLAVTEHGATGLKLIGYDGGTVAFSVSDVVTGASSGASGTVREVIGDTASGELVLHTWNGTAFIENEDLQVSAATRALANLGAGTGGYDLEYWWEVNGSDESLQDIYGWLHTQTAKATPSSWVTAMLQHRVYLLKAGFETERVDNEGVFISNRGSGTIVGMVDDGGTSYVPPTTVDITINVEDESGTAIQNAQCSIFTDPGGVELMNEDTTALGVATEAIPYTIDQAIYWRVRKSEDTDNPRYKARSGTGTITSAGFEITVTLIEQPLPI